MQCYNFLFVFIEHVSIFYFTTKEGSFQILDFIAAMMLTFLYYGLRISAILVQLFCLKKTFMPSQLNEKLKK